MGKVNKIGIEMGDPVCYNQDTDHIRESPAKKCQEVI